MSYQALYRTYRPTTFSEVVGQEHVVHTLKNAIKEHKISHAYVFTGLRGIGKTTIARILAKAVNCENPIDGEPCNQCASCLAISNNDTTDVVELDAASNNGVDEIRSILEKVNFLPSELNKKVYIIDEVHMLTTSAFNALLKTLEEPPAHVMFIMATTEPYKIPLTILSRCQRFDFKQLTVNELCTQIDNVSNAENISIDDDAKVAIAEYADGGMRDALSILDQASTFAVEKITLNDVLSVTGSITIDNLIECVNCFHEQDATKSLEKVNSILESGHDVNRLLTSLIDFCKNILVFKSADTNIYNRSYFSNENFINLSGTLTKNELFYFIEVLIDTQNKIRFSTTSKVFLELAIIKITNLEAIETELSKKVELLDEKINNLELSNGTENPMLEAKVSKLSQVVSSLSTNSSTDYDFKIKSLENKLANITNHLDDISNGVNMNQVEDKIKELTVENTIDNTYVDQKVNECNDNFKLEITELQKQIEELKQLKVENPVIIDNNLEKEDISQEEISHLSDRLTSLESIVSTLESENAVSMADEMNEPINETSNEEIQNIKNTLNELENKVNNISISTEKEHVDTNISYDQNDFNTFKEKTNASIVQLLAQLEELNYIVTKDYINNDNKNAEETECSTEKNDLQDIINRISNVEVGLSEVQANLSKVTSSVNDINIGDICEAIDEINTRIDNITVAPSVEEENNDESFVVEEENEPEHTLFDDYRDEPKEDNAEFEQEELPVEESVELESTEENTDSNQIEEENSVENISTEQVLVEESPVQPIENVVVEEKEQTDDTEDADDVYDIKLLEHILNDAMTKESRQLKERVVEKWKYIGICQNPDLTSIASLLEFGDIQAVCKDAVLIVFDNVEQCNILMDPKNHSKGEELINNVLGGEYKYMCLPNYIFKEQRQFFLDQFSTGIAHPVLRAFNHPELKIISSPDGSSLTKKEIKEKKANDFFLDN